MPLTRQVIPDQGDAHVDEIVEPSREDGFALVGDDLDELVLEQLVPVEEDIVGEPRSRGGDHTGSKVGKGQPQRVGVVAGDFAFLLRRHQLLARGFHLVGTVVDQPQGADGRNGEGNSIGPLRRHLRIGRVSGAMMEAEQQHDEQDLVEELAPALHQEGTGHLAAAVQPIFLGGDLARPHRILHAGGGGHGVFAADADAVDEERPGVAHHPAVLGDAPGGRDHDETQQHDDGILDEAPPSTQPGPHRYSLPS